MIAVNGDVTKEILDRLATVEGTIGDLRSQFPLEAFTDQDTELQVSVSLAELYEANQALARILRILTEQARTDVEQKPLPQAGPDLKSPVLSRALSRVRRDYQVRTYGDLAELTRDQVLQCYQVGEGGANALEELLINNGQSFAVKTRSA